MGRRGLRNRLSSAQAAVVSGRLTEPPAHRAVKGATIEIVELHRSVVTGTDGGFKFANVAAGEYTLRITVPGKKARSVDKRFAVDDDHDFVANVTLTSAAELGSRIWTQFWSPRRAPGSAHPARRGRLLPSDRVGQRVCERQEPDQ